MTVDIKFPLQIRPVNPPKYIYITQFINDVLDRWNWRWMELMEDIMDSMQRWEAGAIETSAVQRACRPIVGQSPFLTAHSNSRSTCIRQIVLRAHSVGCWAHVLSVLYAITCPFLLHKQHVHNNAAVKQ